MNSQSFRRGLIAAIIAAFGTIGLRAQTGLAITEVYSAGSENGTYAADWFELTNFGPTAINITGFRMDDSSESPAGARALRGITSIAAGQSVIFIEGDASGTTDAALAAAFRTAWFGGSPTGLVIGGYGGAGVSLDSFSDGVAIYNPARPTPAIPLTTVFFGTATIGRTFDNAAGVNSYVDPFEGISLLSTVGVNGAFLSANGQEVGSPGAIPEPSTYAAIIGLLAFGGVLLARNRRALAVVQS